MGQHVTCGFIGLAAGGIAGYLTHFGLALGESLALMLVVALVLGWLVGAAAGVFVGLAQADRLLGGLALLGGILGAVAGLAVAIAVLVLDAVIPWFVVAPVIGFVVAVLLCWLCGRGEPVRPRPQSASL